MTTPEDIGMHTRALMDALREQPRVLITDPDNVAAVRAAVEVLDRGPFLEVRSSPHCPPGKILVVDNPAPYMPSAAELRDAGVDAHVARIRAQAKAEFGRTRGGRIAWRLAGWIARLRRGRS